MVELKFLVDIESLGPEDNLYSSKEDDIVSLCAQLIEKQPSVVSELGFEQIKNRLAELIYEYLIVYDDTPCWVDV